MKNKRRRETRKKRSKKKITRSKTYKANAGAPKRTMDLTTDYYSTEIYNLESSKRTHKQPLTVIDLTGTEEKHTDFRKKSRSSSSSSKSSSSSSKRSSRSSSEDLDFISAIQKVFKNDSYRVDETKKNSFEVEIELSDLSKGTSKNKCFHVILNTRKRLIEIDSLKTASDGGDQKFCSLSGNSILRDLIKVAKKLKYGIFVGTDLSFLTLSNPLKTTVDIALFNILKDGQSFYNKAGFYSVDHEDDYRHNQQIRHSVVRDLIKSDKDIKDIESGLDMEVQDSTTFIDLATVIKAKMEHRDYSDKVANTIRKIVELLRKHFQYNNTDLFYKE